MTKLKDKTFKEGTVKTVGTILFVFSLVLMAAVSRLELDGVNGLINQLEVLLSVGMVVLAPKTGVKRATVINIILTVYTFFFGVIVSHNFGALPGVISPAITILICYIIHTYASSAAKANEELKSMNQDLVKTNEEIVQEGEKLTQMVYYDSLTGLPNKQMCIKKIDDMLSQKKPEPFTIIFANIDDFTKINDEYSADMGDVILGTFSYRLRNFCSDSDTVARIAGDEFAIIVPGKRTKQSIKSFAMDLTGDLAAPININGKQLELSVCFGVAMYPANGSNTQAILKSAEKAVNAAKSNGKGKVVFIEGK